MSEQKHELYLIALALVCCAVLVLFNTFTLPSITIKSSPNRILSHSAAATQSDGSKVNINTADVDELMTLYGIGEEKALSIVTYRDENGSYKSTYELINVSGIGDKQLEAILPYITV